VLVVAAAGLLAAIHGCRQSGLGPGASNPAARYRCRAKGALADAESLGHPQLPRAQPPLPFNADLWNFVKATRTFDDEPRSAQGARPECFLMNVSRLHLRLVHRISA